MNGKAEFPPEGRPLVIAHRGFSMRYPENTLGAFQAAVEADADMIEFDIMLSRDRRIVVFHDEELDRTSSGKGLVAATDLAQLKLLDAGSWLNAQFAAERIPTLDEVLERVGGKILLNIEIKSEALDKEQRDDSIELQLCKLVVKYGLEDQVVVSSFEEQFLGRMREAGFKGRLAFITDTGFDHRLALKISKKHGCWSLHPNGRSLTEAIIQSAHDEGIRIYPYTINDPAFMKLLIDLNTDGLITDDPALLLNIIKRAPKTQKFFK